MTPVWLRRMSWSGLWLGPAAWAINQEANYSLVPAICHRAVVFTVISAALALVALAGGLMSLRVARTPLESEWLDTSGGVPRRFVAWVGTGAGILFALAIANQFVATLIVNGCLR
jgi:hypothetical protein